MLGRRLVLAFIVVATVSTPALAAASDAVARGKSVLYVGSLTKLEKARAADHIDPKRIAALEA